jgi:hypothetical protein
LRTSARVEILINEHDARSVTGQLVLDGQEIALRARQAVDFRADERADPHRGNFSAGAGQGAIGFWSGRARLSVASLPVHCKNPPLSISVLTQAQGPSLTKSKRCLPISVVARNLRLPGSAKDESRERLQDDAIDSNTINF